MWKKQPTPLTATQAKTFIGVLQYNKHIQFKVFPKEQNRVDNFIPQYFIHDRESYPMCMILSVGVYMFSF